MKAPIVKYHIDKPSVNTKYFRNLVSVHYKHFRTSMEFNKRAVNRKRVFYSPKLGLYVAKK